MNFSTFKSANKLVTGQTALQYLSQAVELFKIQKPLIVTDQGVVKSGTINHVLDLLQVEYSVYDTVKAEPEIEQVQDCIHVFKQNGNDAVIGVGGGSALDIAKCVAALAGQSGSVQDFLGTDKIRQRDIHLIVIPTTAGTGSEVTNIAILSDTANQMKQGMVSDFLLPDVAIVSPLMSVSCPASVTAASGVDALVHAVEAYISVNRSDITDALALDAIRLIAENLPKAYALPDHLEAREKMATASLMAGLAFGNAGVGAVHALAYPLGGKYKMAHGVSNALMLPYVLKWNVMGCAERFTRIAQAMNLETGTDHNSNAARVIEWLHDFCRKLNIPSGLRAFGIAETDIPALAMEAIKVERLLKNNPRRLTVQDIEAIYQEAY
ncbi:iron-containing alcohol dehydrogenase [Acinetobacter sp. WCHAc010052]|uniref:iron-containing alcohol dehydrogenase n=1 Tax=Acinetobacter sp. WCHAc010052 TaxID=2004647 RepID=UPI000B3CA28F|nr:iron-containing alcohol dehydrogenase [Acinetobacter sp. WCHAc010052]AXY60916.1 iron-containing alcohol dehydrogenase [Acinetobacter sp. WCHAc010052]